MPYQELSHGHAMNANNEQMLEAFRTDQQSCRVVFKAKELTFIMVFSKWECAVAMPRALARAYNK